MLSELESLMVLNAVDNLSNRQIHRLIQAFGSASQILELNDKALSESQLVPQKAIKNILQFPKDKFLKNEYTYINSNIKIIKYTDNDYPEDLREIPDPPIILYVSGKGLQLDRRSIAIVGSRKASLYGMMTARKLSGTLAEKGLVIVSGLAKGIDTAVHKGCLQVNGCTVAVLGCGLGVDYPKENFQLREEIALNGAVISEFPMQTKPLPYHFPRRNRIVSGLSEGVIVVEAAEKSGALITADFALEQGRNVYAVPSMIDQPNSKGVHRLIQEGAKLLTSAEDVIEDFNNVLGSPREDITELNRLDVPLSDEEHNLYQIITDKPLHIDEILKSSEKNMSITTTLLLNLEMKKLIQQLPGKRFKR